MHVGDVNQRAGKEKAELLAEPGFGAERSSKRAIRYLVAGAAVLEASAFTFTLRSRRRVALPTRSRR